MQLTDEFCSDILHWHLQVEDRKKAIMDAEKERREYIVRKNQVKFYEARNEQVVVIARQMRVLCNAERAYHLISVVSVCALDCCLW